MRIRNFAAICAVLAISAPAWAGRSQCKATGGRWDGKEAAGYRCQCDSGLVNANQTICKDLSAAKRGDVCAKLADCKGATAWKKRQAAAAARKAAAAKKPAARPRVKTPAPPPPPPKPEPEREPEPEAEEELPSRPPMEPRPPKPKSREEICKDRCLDSGGTWMYSTKGCRCPEGMHLAGERGGCSCVADEPPPSRSRKPKVRAKAEADADVELPPLPPKEEEEEGDNLWHLTLSGIWSGFDNEDMFSAGMGGGLGVLYDMAHDADWFADVALGTSQTDHWASLWARTGISYFPIWHSRIGGILGVNHSRIGMIDAGNSEVWTTGLLIGPALRLGRLRFEAGWNPSFGAYKDESFATFAGAQARLTLVLF